MNTLKMDNETMERLASALHEMFCEFSQSPGRKSSNAKSRDIYLKHYSELSNEETDLNIAFITDIPRKLALIGYIAIPAGGNDSTFTFRDVEIEKLARMEHKRWVKEKLDAGWQYSKRTDKSFKKHQDIVEWDKLPDSEKEKDRFLVRKIPELLSLAGFKIVKGD